jgi:phosphoenolpyruvate carboxylase
VAESDEESRHWVAANAHAGLGLPVPPGERHRFVKRAVVRLCRPFLKHQVEYNRELLAELVTIRDSLVAQTRSLGASTTEQLAALIERVDVFGAHLGEIGAIGAERFAATNARFDALTGRIDELGALRARVDELGARVDELYSLLEEGSVDRDLVHEEVELAQQHALEHIREACDRIRGELGDLARRTEERQREPTKAPGRVP